MTSQPRTLREAVDRFIRGHDNDATSRAYSQTLDDFAANFGPARPLATITPEDIDAWDATIRARDLASATVRSHRIRMKAFWNWCVDREYIERSPARFLARRKLRVSMASKAIPTDVLRAMTEAVENKRERYTTERDAAILALLINTGARRGDVASVTLSNVNLKERWIVMRTKGDHELRLPLPPQTARLLERWLKVRARLEPNPHHPYVFTTVRPGKDGQYGPLHPGSISTLIKKLSKEVCGKPWAPHSIRHWKGQMLADAGVPQPIVTMILGHSDSKITVDYYYNQDYQRVQDALASTEFAPSSDTPPEKQKKARIIHVDFQRIG